MRHMMVLRAWEFHQESLHEQSGLTRKLCGDAARCAEGLWPSVRQECSSLFWAMPRIWRSPTELNDAWTEGRRPSAHRAAQPRTREGRLCSSEPTQLAFDLSMLRRRFRSKPERSLQGRGGSKLFGG